MRVTIHRSKSRGHFHHGWLETFHSFSFAEYFDPQRVHFGSLRVLNDDTVAGGEGFDMHSHHNMEIITIPLEGELEHQDSMGNRQVIRQGMIQVMSAGTGVRHSEYNKNQDKPAKLLQIWVLPDRQDVEPRYDDALIENLLEPNRLCEIVKPFPSDGNGLWIYQRAWFSLGRLERDTEVEYPLKSSESEGVYIFVIEGEIIIDDDIELLPRDGIGMTDIKSLRIKALTDAEILLMEVPSLN